MTKNFRLCAALLTFCLTACSTIAPTTPSTTSSATTTETKVISQNREQQLKNLQTWQVSGKIAVQTSRDAGSATLNWAQRGSAYTVAIMGPLGAGNMKLTGQGGKVTLEMGDGKRVTASNPEELLAKEWGYHLPVSYLKYWVRGLPVPGLGSDPEYDNQHRLTSLVQKGWTVNYQSYTSVGNLDLPNKIQIASADLKTKIIIYKWNI